MVASGSTSVDRYEASLWKVTTPACIMLIKEGRPLTPPCAAEAVQVGINGVDYTDAQCQFNGSFSIVPNSGGTGERAGVYAIDQNGAPNSIGDATGAGFRCAR
jgi:hypothetical protein